MILDARVEALALGGGAAALGRQSHHRGLRAARQRIRTVFWTPQSRTPHVTPCGVFWAAVGIFALPCGRIYGPMALPPFNRAQDARRPISAGRHGAFRISRRAQAALAPAQGEDQGWFRIGRKRPTTAPARRVSGGIGILRTVQDADGSGADDCLQAGTDECEPSDEPSDERPQLHHPTAQGARRATKPRFVHDAAWSTSVRACPTCGPWGYDHTYSADQQPQQPQQHAKQATPQPCNVQRALTTCAVEIPRGRRGITPYCARSLSVLQTP